MNDRIPLPDRLEKPKTVANVRPDKEARLRDFSLRFAEIFRGMNNAEIARKLGTTDAVVKNYVDGKRFPNDELLLAITGATRVNLHWLLTGNGTRRVEPETSIFDEDERIRIQHLANLHRRSFDDEVRALTMAAVEFLDKV